MTYLLIRREKQRHERAQVLAILRCLDGKETALARREQLRHESVQQEHDEEQCKRYRRQEQVQRDAVERA